MFYIKIADEYSTTVCHEILNPENVFTKNLYIKFSQFFSLAHDVRCRGITLSKFVGSVCFEKSENHAIFRCYCPYLSDRW